MSDVNTYLVMAREAYVVAYVTIFCASVLLWDSIITLDDEITKIWPMRFSFPKILFFVNRYVIITMLVFNGIASSQTHLPAKFCVFYLRWLAVTITVTQATIEAILLIRVVVLYRGNKPVVYTVAFFYTSGILTLVGLTIQDYVDESVIIVQDFNELPGCYAASLPDVLVGYWITPVIVESIFFGLVFWRAVSWWKFQSSAPPTLILMARDSTVYFAWIFVLFIVNLFVFKYGPPFLSSLFVTPVNTVGCIAGSRMMLNLRSLSENSNAATTEIEMSTNLRFTREENEIRSNNVTGTAYTNNEEVRRRCEMIPPDSDNRLEQITEVPSIGPEP